MSIKDLMRDHPVLKDVRLTVIIKAIEDVGKQHAIEFADWLSEMTTIVREEKITLYRYCDQNNEWGNYILEDIYLEFQEHLKRK
jgi:hypothetical protein